MHLGREPEFWAFFSKLSAQEQAATVAQLASQAEEQILAAADAGAAQPYPQQAMAPGYPGSGMPPGGGFPPGGGMPPGGGFPPGGGYPGR